MARNRIARVDLEVGKSRFDRDLASSGRDLRRFARDGKRELGAMNAANDNVGRRARQRLADGGREYTSAANNRKPPESAALRASRAAARGAGVAALAGGVALLSFADDAYALEKGLTRYQIATDSSEASMATFREGLKRASIEAGVSRQELLKGAAAYVALTGDAAGAGSAMQLFGKVVNATGASMEDVAAVAASMKDNLGIDPKDFEAGFSALAVQGKKGAVELRELASQLAGVAPAFSQFDGGMGTRGLIEMGAALQVVRKGFGSSAEAATGLRSLMVAVQRNAGKLGKKKIYFTDENGRKRLRDIRDIVDSIASSKLARDPTALTKAFGSDEAKRAYDQLVQNRALLNSLVTAGSDTGAINRDAATFLESPAGRIQKAWEAVKLTLIEAFTPERIEKFAGALEKVVMLAAKAADLLDKLITGGEKESSLLTVEQLAGASNMSARFGNKRTMPGAGAFKSDEAMFYGRALGGEGDYDLGKLFRYTRAVSNGNQSATQIAGQVAGAVPGGDVVRQVAEGMLQAAGRMDFKVILNGEVLGRAAANSPHHRTRPGGR